MRLHRHDMTKHSMCHCRQPGGGLGLAPGAQVWINGRMQRLLKRWLCAATAVALVGCAAPCGGGDVCAVTGHDGDTQVCDGDHWRTCGTDDGNHGLRIACESSPKVAVCTPSGWTFEDRPAP
jgi:hypothetical protein